LKKETVNDVVFVMANAKLSRKKLFQRPLQELNLRDVSSDNEWIVEENGTPNSVEDDVMIYNFVSCYRLFVKPRF